MLRAVPALGGVARLGRRGGAPHAARPPPAPLELVHEAREFGVAGCPSPSRRTARGVLALGVRHRSPTFRNHAWNSARLTPRAVAVEGQERSCVGRPRDERVRNFRPMVGDLLARGALRHFDEPNVLVLDQRQVRDRLITATPCVRSCAETPR